MVRQWIKSRRTASGKHRGPMLRFRLVPARRVRVALAYGKVAVEIRCDFGHADRTKALEQQRLCRLQPFAEPGIDRAFEETSGRSTDRPMANSGGTPIATQIDATPLAHLLRAGRGKPGHQRLRNHRGDPPMQIPGRQSLPAGDSSSLFVDQAFVAGALLRASSAFTVSSLILPLGSCPMDF
jgi:hypothetical protein